MEYALIKAFELFQKYVCELKISRSLNSFIAADKFIFQDQLLYFDMVLGTVF